MACPNERCDAHGNLGNGYIALRGYTKVKWGGGNTTDWRLSVGPLGRLRARR